MVPLKYLLSASVQFSYDCIVYFSKKILELYAGAFLYVKNKGKPKVGGGKGVCFVDSHLAKKHLHSNAKQGISSCSDFLFIFISSNKFLGSWRSWEFMAAENAFFRSGWIWQEAVLGS